MIDVQNARMLTRYNAWADKLIHAAVRAHPDRPWTRQQFLDAVLAQGMRFAPGEKFSYSNVGYLFVRQIIERAADADLDGALRALVFDPLGIEGVFVAHAPWEDAQRYDPRWVYHGCVVGSPARAATWLHRLIHGSLLAPATKAAMLAPCSYDAGAEPPDDFGYGLGVMIEPAPRGERLIGHAGQGPGSTITVFAAMNARRT